MALLNCEDCGRDVSSKATACPNCGCPVPTNPSPAIEERSTSQSDDLPEAWSTPAPSPNPTVTTSQIESKSSVLKRALTWIVVLIVIGLMIRACSENGTSTPTQPAASSQATPDISATSPPVATGPSEADKMSWAAKMEDKSELGVSRQTAAKDLISNFPQSPEGVKAAVLLPKIEEEIQKEIETRNLGKQWSYESSPEGMSGKEVRTASVISTNTINLGFPYGGPQHAVLRFRRHPRWGNDVIFSIEQGQILCSTYGDCKVQVRFDDEKLLRYKGNPPEDNSSESVFIPAFGTFMKKLKNTKVVKVEVSIYQAGNQVFEFDVSGFNSEKFK